MANINEDKKYHFIYKTTNLINNKYYLGMHSTANLKDGYLGSGTYLRRSIRKYGKENFKCEILEYCETWEKLIEREKQLVNEGLIKDVLCMNLKPGGKGGSGPGKLNGMFGKHHSLKTKVFKSRQTKEWIKNNPKKAKKRCQDATKTIRSGFQSGRLKPSFKDKKHTKKTKELISKINSKKQRGIKNSQYGTLWITKDGFNKKIKLNKLQDWLDLGWNKGRMLR